MCNLKVQQQASENLLGDQLNKEKPLSVVSWLGRELLSIFETASFQRFVFEAYQWNASSLNISQFLMQFALARY